MTIHQIIQSGARQAAGFIAAVSVMTFLILASGVAGWLTGV